MILEITISISITIDIAGTIITTAITIIYYKVLLLLLLQYNITIYNCIQITRNLA